MAGDTVRAVLDSYFAEHPAARGYVLDDRARLRQHMTIFVNGRHVADREALGDAVPADAYRGLPPTRLRVNAAPKSPLYISDEPDVHG